MRRFTFTLRQFTLAIRNTCALIAVVFLVALVRNSLTDMVVDYFSLLVAAVATTFTVFFNHITPEMEKLDKFVDEIDPVIGQQWTYTPPRALATLRRTIDVCMDELDQVMIEASTALIEGPQMKGDIMSVSDAMFNVLTIQNNLVRANAILSKRQCDLKKYADLMVRENMSPELYIKHYTARAYQPEVLSKDGQPLNMAQMIAYIRDFYSLHPESLKVFFKHQPESTVICDAYIDDVVETTIHFLQSQDKLLEIA